MCVCVCVCRCRGVKKFVINVREERSMANTYIHTLHMVFCSSLICKLLDRHGNYSLKQWSLSVGRRSPT